MKRGYGSLIFLFVFLAEVLFCWALSGRYWIFVANIVPLFLNSIFFAASTHRQLNKAAALHDLLYRRLKAQYEITSAVIKHLLGWSGGVAAVVFLYSVMGGAGGEDIPWLIRTLGEINDDVSLKMLILLVAANLGGLAIGTDTGVKFNTWRADAKKFREEKLCRYCPSLNAYLFCDPVGIHGSCAEQGAIWLGEASRNARVEISRMPPAR